MKIEVNQAALKQLMALAEVEAKRRADKIQAAAGDGYESVLDPGVHAAVYTYSAEAIEDNAKNNTLIRSLDAGRD